MNPVGLTCISIDLCIQSCLMMFKTSINDDTVLVRARLPQMKASGLLMIERHR
jgi:hypothetical protein